MSNRIGKILSFDCGPFWQFVKYGAIGVAATLVQTGVFYLLAATCMRCLTGDDIAVRLFGLPAVEFSGSEPWYATRGSTAAAATAIGFFIANAFCWLMNRRFVFRPGKFRWYIEFLMLFSAASVATAIALAAMKLLIDWFGLMTSLAVVVEVLVSFAVNFFVRKFFIFKR